MGMALDCLMVEFQKPTFLRRRDRACEVIVSAFLCPLLSSLVVIFVSFSLRGEYRGHDMDPSGSQEMQANCVAAIDKAMEP